MPKHLSSKPVRLSTAVVNVGETAVSVIVTAVDTETAVTAVTNLNGQITSELSLINAVGATLTGNQIDQLATTAGIVSIVNNHTVSASGGPDCTGEPTENGPCSLPPGWVTDHREKKENVQLPVSLKLAAGLAQLPDGGFVAIAEKQHVAFLNPNGSPRLVLSDLEFEQMSTPPIVTQDGIVYFMGELYDGNGKFIIYAINSSNGEILWEDSRQKNLVQGLAISPDAQYLYVLSNEAKAKLYIFDAANGRLLEKAEPRSEKSGMFDMPPIVAPDGTVYLQSTGKEPDKQDRFSNVIAINPMVSLDDDKAYMWRFEAAFPKSDGNMDLLELDMAPLQANGFVYLFSSKDKVVFALDAETGELMHQFDMPKKLEATPVVGSDGTLYLPAEKHFYAMNPDLTIRFEFVSDGTFSTPVFSPDGTAVYTSLSKTLYALSTETGEELWQVTLNGDIKSQPSFDAQGNIILGSDGKDMVIVTPNGQITTRLRLDDKFGQVVSSSLPDDQMMILVGEKDMLTIGRLSDRWNPEMVDVQPAETKDEWEIVNTISIDIGANVVHNTSLTLPDEDGDLVPTNITGAGITVAVIDSGVYVDGHVKDLLSSDLYATDIKQQYIGQYDFVNDGFGPTCKDDHYNATEGYCYYDWDKSRDPYGHGSHVAGIIWSQITDASTSASMGIAPGANVVSVRVLGNDGNGTYEDVVQGIQWVVNNQTNPELESPIRVMNLSLSAQQTVPYFVDPINRAVEQAWASGIVVLAAAGNEGPEAQTISVPGNDPYIITVGAIQNQRTPGYWADDEIPQWSSSGPTLDGFVKPDILAPGAQIISFMHNEEGEVAQLLQDHPDYAETMSLFRMNGTSMATAVASGVVALMLEVEPDLTPDQVKYRLMASAKPMMTADGALAQSMFQQGMGRIWAPDAVIWNEDVPSLSANVGLDIEADLANPWVWGQEPTPENMSNHYFGPIQYADSDDGTTRIYFVSNPIDDKRVIFGAVDLETGGWIDYDNLTNRHATSSDGNWVWNENLIWAGGYMWVGADGYMWVGADGYMWVGADGYMWVGADGYMWVGADGYMWVDADGYMWVGVGGYMWVGADGYMWVGADGYMWVGADGYMWVGADNLTDFNSSSTVMPQSIAANKWVDDDRPDGFTVHVADLDGATSWIKRTQWQQVITLTTRDEFQGRVSEALVSGNWSDGQTGSCVTDNKGECTIVSNPLTPGRSSISFTVTNVQHELLEYVATDNLDMENDSNGTVISAQRPFQPTVFVNDIDATSAWVDSSTWSLAYTFTIVDHQNQLVENATLSGRWARGLSGTFTCTTDASGACTVAVETVTDQLSEVEAEVLNIDHWLLTYNKDNNHDVDGSSNGTKLKVVPPADRPTVSVADLDAISAWTSSITWESSIVVTLVDNLGKPAANATVFGLWSKGLSGTLVCVTDNNGQCVIEAGTLPESIEQLELEVTAVFHTMLYYDEGNNDDPDNDSDGTKMRIDAPAYRPGMQINSMTGTASWLDGNRWQAEATLTVLDDQMNPVSNAVVVFEWTKGATDSGTCVTDVNGQCTVTQLLSNRDGDTKLEIISLTHEMLIDTFGEDQLTIKRP